MSIEGDGEGNHSGTGNPWIRECVLFIGTRFSNLYTAMDTPTEAEGGETENTITHPQPCLESKARQGRRGGIFFLSARTNKRHHHHQGPGGKRARSVKRSYGGL